MFESSGEVLVLTLSVVVTWMVAWGAAEWRALGYQRRVHRVERSSSARDAALPAATMIEIPTVRVISGDLRRSA